MIELCAGISKSQQNGIFAYFAACSYPQIFYPRINISWYKNMKSLNLIFIFALLITSCYCFSCQTDDDCNHGEGTCQSDHTCYCKWFYQGESCSIRWQDANPGWLDLWIVYCAFTCILQVLIMGFILREILSFPKFRLNMVTLILLLILLGCTSKETSRNLLRFLSTTRELLCRWAQLFWAINSWCRQCYVLYSCFNLLFLLLSYDDALV